MATAIRIDEYLPALAILKILFINILSLRAIENKKKNGYLRTAVHVPYLQQNKILIFHVLCKEKSFLDDSCFPRCVARKLSITSISNPSLH